MNRGEVVTCDNCSDPFEVLAERYFEELVCPYCGEQCKPSGV